MTDRDVLVSQAIEAIGGEDAQFRVKIAGGELWLDCDYEGCKWSERTEEIELWELIADAREHWEDCHRMAVSEAKGSP